MPQSIHLQHVDDAHTVHLVALGEARKIHRRPLVRGVVRGDVPGRGELADLLLRVREQLRGVENRPRDVQEAAQDADVLVRERAAVELVDELQRWSRKLVIYSRTDLQPIPRQAKRGGSGGLPRTSRSQYAVLKDDREKLLN